jgi:hypothetical protein
MGDRRGLLVGIVVIAVLGILLAGWLRWRGSEPPPIEGEGELQRFAFAEVALDSPDLAVAIDEVRGVVHSGHTSWSVTLTCAERDGCAGELAATVDYRGGSENLQIAFVTRCDVAEGGVIRFDGLQDPPTPVSRIDRVSLEVIGRSTPGAWPTPSDD